MNKLFFLLSALLLLSSKDALCQKMMHPTHKMELINNNNSSTLLQNAELFIKQKTNFITIAFKEGTKTAQIINSNSNEFKFQFSQIKNNELVNIYFIGYGNLSDKITGQFNASIDGIQRIDLSGTFTLTKNKESQMTQNKVGGHFGIVHGLFALKEGNLSSIFSADTDYSIGFPMGITVKKRKNFAFDLEIVPFITVNKADNVENISLLIHPGLLWGLGNNLTFGTRLAFELGDSGRYGITPLLNFGNIFPSGFVEIVLPIRVGSNEPLTIALGIHIGMGF